METESKLLFILSAQGSRWLIEKLPAQRDSEISIFGRLSGVLCWPHGQASPTVQLAVRLVHCIL